MEHIDYEILIDDTLSRVTSKPELVSTLNKYVVSMVNDFEDGMWRQSKFQSYVWDNIALTALSARERSALVNNSHSSLVAAARNVRLTDKDAIGKGSEIAEILLYGVMRQHFKALPVVPKIFYKQNTQDNAKGADSVHIVIDGDDFTLWFGEAKFYNSIADARLDSIVDSVINSLSTNKLKKENSIITNVSDLETLPISESLRTKITSALSNRESIDNLKPKIHIPILILHECAITQQANELSDTYKKQILALHIDRAESYFAKQIAKSKSIHKYNELQFHIILLPVPNKEQIINSFVQTVAFYKGMQ